MLAALAEPVESTSTSTSTSATTICPDPASKRAEASRANGRLSRGPTSLAGKERSRRNGCKEGLTGAGVVLPPDADAEVERRAAEFSRDFRPRNAIERELVRQMALGAWRREVLFTRILRHDARSNAARFATWEQDERIAATENGRRLGDDPEGAVARLQRSSAGCDWLVGRWTLLGNGLLSSDGDEGGPGCTWTDADLALALALDLLGLPAELRHLDRQAASVRSLCAQARSGSDEAVDGLLEIVAEQVAELEHRSEEVWEGVEQPRLEDWRSGVEMDLGPEGTRLRRYEAAADRLFRSAWTKLEGLRKERGVPLMHRSEREPAAEPAARPEPPASPSPEPAPRAVAPPPVRPETAVSAPAVRNDPSPVLDFWIGGPPTAGTGTGTALDADELFPNKTNPAPGRPAHGAQAARCGKPR